MAKQRSWSGTSVFSGAVTGGFALRMQAMYRTQSVCKRHVHGACCNGSTIDNQPPAGGLKTPLGRAQSAQTRQDPVSLLTTPFGFHSTPREIIRGVDLTGRRAVVTGGAAGIGIETARALAQAGAHVVLAVRRPDAAAPVVEALQQSTGNRAISAAPLDL